MLERAVPVRDLSGTYRYLALENVHFGRPAEEVIAEEAEKRRSGTVVVVASRTLNRKTPAVKNAVSRIDGKIVSIFDDCREHTPRETAITLADELRRVRADLVVTIGGGTAIDTVKVALICLAENLTKPDELDDWHIRVSKNGERIVPHPADPPLRQIVVPTTLSAAEFSDLGGATDTRRGVKHLYTGSKIGAAAVVLDPEMTRYTPDRLWLSTGIRAVDHAVETICSINAQPMTDVLAREGLQQLSEGLPVNATTPDDMAARLGSQMGVWLASCGLNRVSFGASHGLGHVLGAAAGVPHGITSCVLLPAVLAYNAPILGERAVWISEALGRTSTAGEDVRALIEMLGLPSRLSDIGVSRDQFSEIAGKGFGHPWVKTNPRPIESPEDIMTILEAAF